MVVTAGDGIADQAVPTGPEGYRAHLDGVRAVAVYLVVFFHSGVDRMSGGFIGVDIFFVMSGYLVTQILLKDLASYGRLRFGRFYSRRFRRLLPASVVALLGTALVYSWFASATQVDSAVDSIRASFLYIANWFFIHRSTDYFASEASPSPVLHFWSLAVEEQFYLAWPILLAGLAALAARIGGRRRWDIVRLAVGVAAIASVVWAWYESGHAPSRAYYGTDTRVYQLLAGALVALTPSLINRFRRLGRGTGWVAVLALAGLVVESSSLITQRPVARGIAACLLTVALLVSLESADGPLRRWLSSRPMAELGRISYGTYLWHWPVIVIAGLVADLSPLRMTITAVVVGTGLASLSSWFLEQPIRSASQLDRIPRGVVFAGLTTGLVCGLLILPLVPRSPDRKAQAQAQATSAANLDLTPVPASFDQRTTYDEGFDPAIKCLSGSKDFCEMSRGKGPHVVLLGDSNAVMFREVLDKLAHSRGLTFTSAAKHGCGWQRGFYYEGHDDLVQACKRNHDMIYTKLLPETKPDIIIAVDVRDLVSVDYSKFRGTPHERQLRDATAESVKEIRAIGATLVVIEPLPRTLDIDPLNCLATATFEESCQFRTDLEPYWFDTDLRRLADDNDRMWSVDLDRVVCPRLPICDPVLNGQVVRWDGAHLTRRFALTIEDDLAERLVWLGVLPQTAAN